MPETLPRVRIVATGGSIAGIGPDRLDYILYAELGGHLMILLPGGDYSGISTEAYNGGPWIMWAGTPYVHLMVPIESHGGM